MTEYCLLLDIYSKLNCKPGSEGKSPRNQCNSCICLSNTATFHILWMANFFLAFTHKKSEMKKSVWPKHTGNMNNVTELRWNHNRIDGFPTDFSSEFCQGDIQSQFRCNSVVILSIPRIFHGSKGFLT